VTVTNPVEHTAALATAAVSSTLPLSTTTNRVRHGWLARNSTLRRRVAGSREDSL
jgi:hypothetical protein